jgi:hypothetical protein
MTTVWYAKRIPTQATTGEDIAMGSKTSMALDTELEAIEATATMLRTEARQLVELGISQELALELAELAGSVGSHKPHKGDTPGGGVTDSSGVRWVWTSVERP